MRDRERLLAPVPVLVALATLAVVTRAVLSLPRSAEGLYGPVAEAAARAGISNRVTAVLLDFRGYDTLLEIAVLMLATVAVLSLREDPRQLYRRLSERATPVLAALTRILVPLAFVVSVHLVWIGSSQPGGAFQAAAVLGATGILLSLSGYARPQWVGRTAMRSILAVGLLTFIGIAVLAMVAGGALLEYPEGTRKTLMLVIESLLTLSIGASLASLFLSSASGDSERDGR
ncbi:MAG: MnhB domain-containing protein [Anaerosomatales bacterium]|nr:MnhB domain-containing protein [Anaerosomatales bacterium]